MGIYLNIYFQMRNIIQFKNLLNKTFFKNTRFNMLESFSKSKEVDFIDKQKYEILNENLKTSRNSEKEHAPSKKTNPNLKNMDKVLFGSTFEDKKSSLQEAIRGFINTTNENEPFFIADMDSITSQHDKWLKNLPRFQPHYAVKSNNNPMVLKTLIDCGTNFDCASLEEIKTMLEMGVPAKKIIFANPVKAP